MTKIYAAVSKRNAAPFLSVQCQGHLSCDGLPHDLVLLLCAGEMSLTDMTVKAEEAAAAAALAAQQLPAKLDARIREVEHELARTIQLSSDYHKQVVKNERKVKELQFQTEEDAKNQVRG